MINKNEQFTALFHSCADNLVLYALQWIHRRADAEDVVQEAFVSFWSRDTEVSDPVAYLYRSVRNTAINALRSKARRRQREHDRRTPLFYTSRDSLEEEQLRSEVELALDKLPIEQREIVIMRTWGELRFRQIAEALDIPEPTARSRHRYGIEALRQSLDSGS